LVKISNCISADKFWANIIISYHWCYFSPCKVSYHIVNNKMMSKNIISYHWWYFSRHNLNIIQLMISPGLKLSYPVDWPQLIITVSECCPSCWSTWRTSPPCRVFLSATWFWRFWSPCIVLLDSLALASVS
jgi:hypothetical protein